MIATCRAYRSVTHAVITGEHFGGLVSAADLREMATPEFAAKCIAIADEIEGHARVALREATRDSERAIARHTCPPTKRGDR